MNIEGVVGLFPLTKIDNRLVHYYINSQGHVYSTKQYAKPRRMSGSYTSGVTYYTLGIGRNRSTSKRGDDLLAMAKLHTDCAKEIAASPIVTKIQDRSESSADFRPLVATGIERKGYIIGQVQGEALVFGSKPKIHLTMDSVKTEVARLAAKSPGTQIIYLQIQGGAVAEGMRWL